MSIPNLAGLLPSSPQEDVDLDALFQALVVGLTGLAGALVRPRWQPIPPAQPDASVDWCAIGILSIAPIYGPQITANPPTVDPVTGDELDDGTVTYVLHESIELLASFYGPNAGHYAGYLRDGVAVPPNMDALESVGFGYVESGAMRTASMLINQQFVRSIELPLTFRRIVTRVYAIPNVAISSIHLFDDTDHVDRSIPVPPGSPIS